MPKDKKFDLHKGGGEGFDLSKGGKRKFDLTKDHDEPEVVSMADAELTKPSPTDKPVEETVAPSPSQPAPPNVAVEPEIEEEKKRNNAWMWIILALLVIILLVWWLWPAPKDSEPKTLVDEVENVISDSTPSDSVPSDSIQPTVADASNEQSASTPTEAPANSPANAAEAPSQSAPVAQPAQPAAPAGSIEAEALNVIRGDYGNNPVRKEKLGSRYPEIQKMVNQMKRNGKF